MGIEEAILQYEREEGLKEGEYKTKIKGIRRMLERGKLTEQEIAEDLEVSLEFVQKVHRREI